MDRNSIHSSQTYSTTPTRAAVLLKKVQVVYFLSYRGGLLEQPHLMEISLSSSRGLCLRDVKIRLAGLRGVMPTSFSWSYKRSYKEGFVWQDLESDNDLIFPTHNGSEYVIKGCRIESSGTVEQNSPSTQNEHGNSTPMQSTSRFTELPAPATENQFANAVNLVAIDDHTNNKSMVGSPFNTSSHRHDDNTFDASSYRHVDNNLNASSHRHDDNTLNVTSHRHDYNIPFNLGVIEGLEHLHLSDLNYDYAESQASIPLNYCSHNIARVQNKKDTENLRPRKKPSDCKLHLRGPIVEREPYESTEFSVIKKVKTSLNPSPYVGADATTQTGEDDGTMNITVEYGKCKLQCLPNFYNTDNLPSLKSREGAVFKQKVSLQELSREEISPPPCSTSSSSTTTSANSASSSNVVSSNVDQLQKLNLDKSSALAENQNPQEAEMLLSARVSSDKETTLDKEEAMATKSPLHHSRQGRETPSLSTEFDAVLTADAVDDHIRENPKSALNSSKIKPHAMSLCSSSGRFLHLVSCGSRGLEVIKPVATRWIQRTPSMSYIRGDTVCEKASGMQRSNLSSATSKEYSCLDLSPLHANVESENATNLDSCLPFAANHVPGKMLCNGDNNLVALSPQDRKSGSKTLWHLRGWFHSNYKKKKNPKSKSTSINSAIDENAYTCLDLFEKHVPNSSTDCTIEDYSSSQRRLIRVGSFGYSSSSHQRSSSYDSNPSTNFINEWLASPLQGPQIGSRESINVGGESKQLAWRNYLPLYGLTAKEANPFTLQIPKNDGTWR